MSRPSPALWLLAVAACAPGPVAGGDSDLPVPDDLVPACTTDADCDDADPCDGSERCGADGTCLPGTAVACDPGETCVIDGAAAACATLCPLPRAPMLRVLHPADVLTFTVPAATPGAIETAVIAPGDPVPPTPWPGGATVDLGARSGPVRVLARVDDPACGDEDRFDHVYDVQPAFPGAAGDAGTEAVDASDARIGRWADEVVEVRWGEALDATWQVPEAALGPAEGTSTDACSLGRGGVITLRFDPPIADGTGPDLAVFENAFSDTFLELGVVEVSSDGNTFARFDTATRDPVPKGAFDLSDPTLLSGFAGLHRQGFGTPFDLSLLRYDPAVRAGRVDLGRISHVRVVDVVGDGRYTDAWGRPVYDPYPTTGSAGFDLDAVAVLDGALP